MWKLGQSVHISILRAATGKGLVWGGAIVTARLAYGTLCEAEAGKPVHADASDSCVKAGNTLVPTPTWFWKPWPSQQWCQWAHLVQIIAEVLMSQDGFLAILAWRHCSLQSWDIHHLNRECEETGFSICIYWQMVQCAKCPFYCKFPNFYSKKFGFAFTLSHNPLSTELLPLLSHPRGNLRL